MTPAADLPGLGGSLALSFVSLGVVCVIAWVALRFLARQGLRGAKGPLRVVARCPLDPRRSICIVEAAGRFFLVGVGEGPVGVLAELDAATLHEGSPTAEAQTQLRGGAARFADVLARVAGRSRS